MLVGRGLKEADFFKHSSVSSLSAPSLQQLPRLQLHCTSLHAAAPTCSQRGVRTRALTHCSAAPRQALRSPIGFAVADPWPTRWCDHRQRGQRSAASSTPASSATSSQQTAAITHSLDSQDLNVEFKEDSDISTSSDSSTQNGGGSCSSSSSVEYDEATKTVRIPLAALEGAKRRTRMVTFTCNKCGGRTTRFVNPLAWDRGLVFCQCEQCKVWHTLASNNPGIYEEIVFGKDSEVEAAVHEQPVSDT